MSSTDGADAQALTIAERERDEARSLYQSAHCHRLSLQSEVVAMRAVLKQAERERDEAREQANTLLINCESYFQDSCRMRKERDEARAEVGRLRTALLEVQTSESAAAWFSDGFHEGWKAGAEAMRERCAMEVRGKFLGTNSDLPRIEVAVRIEAALLALPIPGEP